ncbi:MULTISPECIES: NAD(P)/FAD-dependent oxidoreductase [unclassified Oceanispirochaeta]|nr:MULTISPECIES: NAD(P)/FAD-dependent oxidoreductase [unclassified Oceanispirochaeta]MBF9014338.1 NAD(P)/FAD-dependent oxidoreductase [Oceanispirochaeta sp. M2]NPD71224.1 NAD(P)/FAD-dependent oxidoreductase [Oceanispirochaeta sp. M1]
MSYDAVVMGAGLGGLCAAFELSKNGIKTLLLEQHNLPGGFASSFVRGRFEFEPSLHEIPDPATTKDIRSVIRYLKDDAELDIDFLEIPEAYRVILTEKNLNVRVPFGWDNLIDVIADNVPGSREPLENYRDLCIEVQAAFGYLNNHQDDLSYLKLLREHGNFIRTGSYTAEEVADALKIPQAAKDILYPYWCYLGVPMERVSFSLWASMLNAYMSHSAAIPTLRSHEISSAFIHAIEAQGGECRMNSRVDKILTENGEVRGVRLSSGEEISCPNVVCNSSPTRVYSSLISPSSDIPKMAHQNVNSRIHGFSLAVVYLGLDIDHKSLGLEDYSYFIAPHMDTEELYEASHDYKSENIMQASVCLNVGNPGCSPPGTCILSMTVGQSDGSWDKILPVDYFEAKKVIADIMINQFESATGVDLRSHIEEIEVATPQTFARYTGAWNGLVYGYEPEPWDGIIPRVLGKEKENYFKGLVFCGGYSYRAHGYSSSILSGKAAAEDILSSRGDKS